ncbi:hypothetical protein MPLA_320182 [Mesorhizobium sp. ORS 3359]|nr:hypothetical protein MPLA_320182 [Mesorhizobium sp. ORS 3359]
MLDCLRQQSRDGQRPRRRSGRAWSWRGADAPERSSGSFRGGQTGGQRASSSSPFGCSDGSPSLDGVGQLVFAGADIGSLRQKLNRKNEALDMKSDTICDIFGQCAHNFLLVTMPYLAC